MGNNPELVVKCGDGEGAVFINQVKTGDGRDIEIPKIKFQKRYKDADESWQSTYYFDRRDLWKIIAIAEKINEILNLKIFDGKGNQIQKFTIDG